MSNQPAERGGRRASRRTRPVGRLTEMIASPLVILWAGYALGWAMVRYQHAGTVPAPQAVGLALVAVVLIGLSVAVVLWALRTSDTPAGGDEELLTGRAAAERLLGRSLPELPAHDALNAGRFPDGRRYVACITGQARTEMLVPLAAQADPLTARPDRGGWSTTAPVPPEVVDALEGLPSGRVAEVVVDDDWLRLLLGDDREQTTEQLRRLGVSAGRLATAVERLPVASLPVYPGAPRG